MSAVRSLFAAAILVLMTSTAMAGPIYSYEIDNPPGSANAGDITNIATTFDEDNEIFTWSYSIKEKSPGVFSDAFWLVVSDGPNPKGINDQLAIIYGDLDSNTLTVYNYNGQNNSASWTVGTQIASETGLITTTQANIGGNDIQTASFSLDVSSINDQPQFDPNWEGIRFDDTLGIWFHPGSGSNFTYDNAGNITGFSHQSQGWYDTSNRTTVNVPTPATAALMLLGLVGFAAGRRRKANA